MGSGKTYFCNRNVSIFWRPKAYKAPAGLYTSYHMTSQYIFNSGFLMPDQAQEQSVARLLRQQAALAAFGSYAFREPVLVRVLSEAARVCAEALDVPLNRSVYHLFSDASPWASPYASVVTCQPQPWTLTILP